MDEFDKYLFDEISGQYAKRNLTQDEYEEIFNRFLNIDYLEEVKPYLLAMRYFGWGVAPDSESVLDELKLLSADGDNELTGLYYDLMICSGTDNSQTRQALETAVSAGYSAKYAKEKSNIKSAEPVKKVVVAATPKAKETKVDTTIRYKYMSFFSCGYSGYVFTSGDIDYLYAKIFVEPCEVSRKVHVDSQIYDSNGNTFSKVFSDDIELKPNNTWFTTTGWGNKDFYGYPDGTYQWVIKINNSTTTYSENFRVYRGKLTAYGPRIKDVKLFSSKYSGALDRDKESYSSTFNGSSLESIYFKLFIENPGKDMNVQIFYKVEYLEDESVFKDFYEVFAFESDTCACWTGIGFPDKGKWKKGLYRYSIHIGKGPVSQGTFTVN